jgi:oligogalacturonide lyase
MSKGRIYPCEWHVGRDPVTGVAVRRLTDWHYDSHHLYFTNSGWYSGNEKLIFASVRNHQYDLFAVDLSDGEIVQLTDGAKAGSPTAGSLLFTSVNACRPEAYFWRGRELIALDLETLSERQLYLCPAGYSNNMTTVTADGRYVCTGHYADLGRQFDVDPLHGYVGFRKYWQARPHSMIVKIDTASGDSTTVFEESYWIGHVNASPTLSHLVTFCHEGPWDEVDNRIWGLDIDSGQHWMIRPRRDRERVGHEFWFADGRHIGYQCANQDGLEFFRTARSDNAEIVEMPLPIRSMHVHANDLNLVVGDGTREDPWLYAWRCSDGSIEGPYRVARHDCRARTQQTHVHPRLSPDGRRIVGVSDKSGHGSLFMIETAELNDIFTFRWRRSLGRYVTGLWRSSRSPRSIPQPRCQDESA